jgi:hypothetical protein
MCRPGYLDQPCRILRHPQEIVRWQRAFYSYFIDSLLPLSCFTDVTGFAPPRRGLFFWRALWSFTGAVCPVVLATGYTNWLRPSCPTHENIPIPVTGPVAPREWPHTVLLICQPCSYSDDEPLLATAMSSMKSANNCIPIRMFQGPLEAGFRPAHDFLTLAFGRYFRISSQWRPRKNLLAGGLAHRMQTIKGGR